MNMYSTQEMGYVPEPQDIPWGRQTIQTCPVTQKTQALSRKINPVSSVVQWGEVGGQI